MAQHGLVPAVERERAWVAALVKRNMREAYARHALCWDSAAFNAAWSAGENFLLWSGAERIGYLRLWQEGSWCYLQDLQVVAEHRGQGWGSHVLDAVKMMAWRRGMSVIRLKVFEDSSAVRLYQHHGFETLMRCSPFIGMQLAL